MATGFESVDEILQYNQISNQMTAIDQFFPVVMFVLCKVVTSFESVDETLQYNQSNESYRAVLSCGAVYNAVQGGYEF